MRFPLLACAVLGLSACGGGPLRCPYLSHPDPVDLGVVTLDPSAAATENPFNPGPGEVIQSTTAWNSAIGRWGTDGNVVPNFTTQMVFVYRWEGGGCTDPMQYAAWSSGDKLRVVAVEGDSSSCSGDVPQIDLLVVARGIATDISWCAGG